MHSCLCSQHSYRLLRPSRVPLLRNGALAIISKRCYADNPKWTSQAEEQFGELFKVKEKPPPEQQPSTTIGGGPKTKSNTMPPPSLDDTPIPKISPLLQTPSSSILRRPMAPPPSMQGSPLLQSTQSPFQQQMQQQQQYQLQQHKQRTTVQDPNSYNKTDALAQSQTVEEVPGVPAFGEQYASYTRMETNDARPSKPFTQLEAEEREPQLTDERESVIKLWLENLPVTDETTIQESLSLLVEHPINVSGLEVVTERGMIATKSAFMTVDFGLNDREKIFYKLENFGLTIKGMRCPVRTAEVKRSLTLIELGQISEEALVTALRDHEIKYQTYDYPGRYISPQRQIAFPYRGSVLLTFRSHAEAYVMKKRFDAEEGVMIGDKRIYAMWGPRAGSMPLEIRTAANYMRNLIWENRDLRKYVGNARQVNAGWKEPAGFTRLTDMFEKQHKSDFERQAQLDDIRKQLEETQRELQRAQGRLKEEEGEEGAEREEGERTEVDPEVIESASTVLAKAKELEVEIQKETILGRIQAKTVLDEIGQTRSISPFVPRIEDNMGLSQVEEQFDKSFAALKEKHDKEYKRLKEVHVAARKKVVQEVFAKNHRNVGETASELGVSRVMVSKDTRLKARKKVGRKKKKIVEAQPNENENENNNNNNEGETESGGRETGETEGGEAETEGGEAREEVKEERGEREAETEGGEAKETRQEEEIRERENEKDESLDSNKKLT